MLVIKVIIALCIAIFLLSSEPVLAGDPLWRMLHAEEVESFMEDQDAIVVGQLIGRQKDKFSVRVLKVISGNVDSDSISVASDFYYGWWKVKPAVNDFCVMSIKKSQGVYRNAWGIFKADSGDYKTLKLVSNNAKSSGLSMDSACIEWFVNSGGTENDFSFDYETAYVKRPNGEVVQIYPKLTTNSSTSLTSVAQNQKTVTTVVLTGKRNLIKKQKPFIVAAAAVLLVGAIAVYLKFLKNTTK